MVVNGLTKIVLVVSMIGGCGRELSGNRISVGLTVREMKGDYQDFQTKKATLPVYEVRIARKLARDLDVYVRGQFNQGQAAARHAILEGRGEGYFGGVGGGLNYFPLTIRVVGFDIGGEIYQAKYLMRGWYGPITQETRDCFWGGGINAGLIGEIPLDKTESWRVVWSMGYDFTQTETKKAIVDLDGWYGTVAVRIDLLQK